MLIKEKDLETAARLQRALECAKEITQDELDDIGIDRDTFREWMLGVRADCSDIQSPSGVLLATGRVFRFMLHQLLFRLYHKSSRRTYRRDHQPILSSIKIKYDPTVNQSNATVLAFRQTRPASDATPFVINDQHNHPIELYQKCRRPSRRTLEIGFIRIALENTHMLINFTLKITRSLALFNINEYNSFSSGRCSITQRR